MAKSLKKSGAAARSDRKHMLVNVRPAAVTAKDFSAAIKSVRQMTLDERVQSLIDAGILTKSGKRLARRYRSTG
jgi:hypothetical protein